MFFLVTRLVFWYLGLEVMRGYDFGCLDLTSVWFWNNADFDVSPWFAVLCFACFVCGC